MACPFEKGEGMKTVQVTLGGKEYNIRALKMRQSKEWRDKVKEPFGSLVDALQAAPNIELTSMADLSTLVDVVKDLVLGSFDLVLDLLFQYSPELAADRERIETEGYDEEAVEAFVEVLKLAFPFGGFRKVFSTLPGPANQATSMNSPSASGDLTPQPSMMSSK